MLLLLKLEKIRCFFQVAGFRQKAAESKGNVAGITQIVADSNRNLRNKHVSFKNAVAIYRNLLIYFCILKKLDSILPSSSLN